MIGDIEIGTCDVCKGENVPIKRRHYYIDGMYMFCHAYCEHCTPPTATEVAEMILESLNSQTKTNNEKRDSR